MVLVYQYNEEFGFYEGEREARLDPIEGQPLLPDENHPSRTVVAPPPHQVGMARVFDRGTQTWSVVENHHGETVYTKVGGIEVILRLGKRNYPTLGPIPAVFTNKPRPSFWHKWDEASNDWVEDTTARTEYETGQAKDVDYSASDPDRDTVWDRIDNSTRAQFKTWLDGQITDQASAKTAIIALALEIARIRRLLRNPQL